MHSDSALLGRAGNVRALMTAPLLLLLARQARSMETTSDARLASLRRSAKKIETLHEKKRPPRPRDWLAQHWEAGQTFDQYLKSNPSRPSATRTRLYIQPLGEFSLNQRRLVDEASELMSRFYNLPVNVLGPLSLELIPAEARRTHPKWGDRQILTTYVLDKLLKPRRPADAVAMLALTASDLWPGENWNFVFGLASLSERVGVWSLYRYGDADDDRPANENPFRRRLFKVALHETGHMFGIPHCTAYECFRISPRSGARNVAVGGTPAVEFAHTAQSRGAAADNASYTPPPLRGFTGFCSVFPRASAHGYTPVPLRGRESAFKAEKPEAPADPWRERPGASGLEKLPLDTAPRVVSGGR